MIITFDESHVHTVLTQDLVQAHGTAVHNIWKVSA